VPCGVACIMRLRIFAVLLLAASVQAFAAEPRSRRLADQWQRADVNGDGRLSRDEASSMPRLARAFDDIDRNADGFADAEEVRIWRRRPGAAGKSPGAGRKPTGLSEWLARADANGDGALDRREVEAALPRMARNFDAMDADHDGALTKIEIEAWVARRAVRR
jgi:Ca2+-binding EF-hand superfamily protein